jgi:hypothetical protein
VKAEAWYRELVRQGYSEERAHLRAFGVLVTEEAPEPKAYWWPSEEDIYLVHGDPLELLYGPRE